ncbi:MAG: Crp/Fnr family transcriptional regulator [Bacteroidales bacterium]|nr:Crp/Fnr family transcriptional regulator [Bacteroidales bacterium]
MDPKEQFTGCTISPHKCRCFEKLTDKEKEILDKRSVVVRYKKGEVICKQGSFASHVMYMEKGLAKVFLDDGVNSLVLKIIPEGNLLGLSSVSDENNKFQYSVLAYVYSEVKQIDIHYFKQLLSQNPAFAKEVIDIMGANSAQINGRFFCLTHKQSYGRLADILLCLSDRIFKTEEFILPLSRKDLAELSGMSSETVIRMLKKFHDDGLILLDGKNFKILDYERLKQISEKG